MEGELKDVYTAPTGAAVSEPFGAWCRENFHPNPKDRRAEASRFVDQFFNQGTIHR